MNDRDRWLVVEGYIAGFCAANGKTMRNERISDKAKAWLDSEVADGATVAMALEHEVNKPRGTTMSDEIARFREAITTVGNEPWSLKAMAAVIGPLLDVLETELYYAAALHEHCPHRQAVFSLADAREKALTAIRAQLGEGE